VDVTFFGSLVQLPFMVLIDMRCRQKFNFQTFDKSTTPATAFHWILPTMPASKGNDRTYLREEERAVLQSLLQEWSSKPDKKTRDAFVSGVVVPKIQELNLQEYGSGIISTNKVARVQWEKRVLVCRSRSNCL